MNDRFKFRVWNGSEMHHNDFVVTATGYVGKITEEFLGQCVFRQDDLTADNECILMQCTGLKDKNGKLIYEGDIVRKQDYNALGYFRERICTVFWWKILAGWAIETTLGDAYSITDYESHQLEVIGNIYENPELLQEC